MASLTVDFSNRSSQVYVKSTVTMDVVLPEPSTGWDQTLNTVAGSDMSTINSVNITDISSVNGVE